MLDIRYGISAGFSTDEILWREGGITLPSFVCRNEYSQPMLLTAEPGTCYHSSTGKEE